MTRKIRGTNLAKHPTPSMRAISVNQACGISLGNPQGTALASSLAEMPVPGDGTDEKSIKTAYSLRLRRLAPP